MGGPGRNKRAVSFGACGGARCQPGLWPWERPAAGGRRSVQHAVPQLMRRCLFRRAPPLSAWHSLLGPGCLVDRPRWGAWIHCREEGLATRPWGRDQPRAEGVHSRAGPRASRSRPWGGRSVPPRGAGWHLCCSRSGDTRPCVGHGRREQSRSSAGQLSVSEEGQRAGCQRQHWGQQATAGVPTPRLCGWDPRPCASQWLPALSARSALLPIPNLWSQTGLNADPDSPTCKRCDLGPVTFPP